MGFSGHRPGKKGLAGSGRAYKQGALWKVCTDIRILLGVVEEIHNLL